MKTKFKLNDLFNNDKFLLFFSLFAALVIWLLVVVNVSPATTRVIQGVKVNIDSTVPSQFGLEVFGEKEFTVDVTVKGKKYQISPAALSAAASASRRYSLSRPEKRSPPRLRSEKGHPRFK